MLGRSLVILGVLLTLMGCQQEGVHLPTPPDLSPTVSQTPLDVTRTPFPSRTPLPPTATLAPINPDNGGGALPAGARLRIGIGGIRTVAISHDGLSIALGTQSGLYVYDAQTLTQKWRKYTHLPVDYVEWSADDTRLATVYPVKLDGVDSWPDLWDAVAGERITALDGGEEIRWSPDGSLLAVSTTFVGDRPSGVKLYDAVTGILVDSLPIDGEWYINDMQWSPDGSVLAGAGTDIEYESDTTGEVFILKWTLGSDEPPQRYEWKTYNLLNYRIDPADNSISIAALDRDRKNWSLVRASDNSRVLAFSTQDRFSHTSLSPSGKYFAHWGEGKIEFMTQEGMLSSAEISVISTYSDVFWSPDESIAVVYHQNSAAYIRPESGEVVADMYLNLDDYGVSHEYEWFPDSRRLAWVSGETLAIIEPEAGIISRGFSTIDYPGDLLWLDQNTLAVSPRYSEATVTYWDVNTGAQLPPPETPPLFDDDESGRADVIWSPDHTMAAQVKDGVLTVTSSQGVLGTISDQQIIDADGIHVTWSPDNRMVSIAGNTFGGCIDMAYGLPGGSCDDEGGKVLAWSLDSRSIVGEMFEPTISVGAMAWSPDGRRLFVGWGNDTSGTGSGSSFLQSPIRILDVFTGEVKTLFGHTESVTALSVSPDGNWLASGSLDGTVIIWNVP